MGISSSQRRTGDESDLNDASAAPAVLRLHQADDLVQAVPYLIGFRPRDSVVLVGIESGRCGATAVGGRVRITVRMDIADLCADGPLFARPVRAVAGRSDGYSAAVFAAADDGANDGADDGARRAAVAIRRAGADAVVGLMYIDSDIAAGQSDEASARARAACAGVGLELGDLVTVDSSDTDESANSEVDLPGAATSRIAAEATYAGLVARDDRGELLSLLEPEPAAHRVRLRPELDREEVRTGGLEIDGRRRRRGAVRALFAASRTLAVLDDEQLVRFGAALITNEVRDACWLAIEAGRIDGEPLWRELACRLPAPYDAAPLFLFGWQRWRGGDGVLAGMAARRALDSDPSYSAAQLLDIAITDGLDPFRTPRLRKGT